MEAIKRLTGKKAPSFTLPDSYGEKISLKELMGKWVILYFYPRDNTSGCTTEALDFTAKQSDFENEGAVIVGISPDSCSSHQGFMVKHSLGITLLSDSEKKVSEKYGVWQKKSMYGKEYYGIVRTTFLIDPYGKIVHSWDRVKVKGHADDVYTKLRVLKDA